MAVHKDTLLRRLVHSNLGQLIKSIVSLMSQGPRSGPVRYKGKKNKGSEDDWAEAREY
jgi:hypothetical protein